MYSQQKFLELLAGVLPSQYQHPQDVWRVLTGAIGNLEDRIPLPLGLTATPIMLPHGALPCLVAHLYDQMLHCIQAIGLGHFQVPTAFAK